MTEPRQLRVAVWLDDEYCRCDTEYVAALRATAESLAAAGARVDFAARPDLSFETAFHLYIEVLNPSMAGQGVECVLEHDWDDGQVALRAALLVTRAAP